MQRKRGICNNKLQTVKKVFDDIESFSKWIFYGCGQIPK